MDYHRCTQVIHNIQYEKVVLWLLKAHNKDLQLLLQAVDVSLLSSKYAAVRNLNMWVT